MWQTNISGYDYPKGFFPLCCWMIRFLSPITFEWLSCCIQSPWAFTRFDLSKFSHSVQCKRMIKLLLFWTASGPCYFWSWMNHLPWPHREQLSFSRKGNVVISLCHAKNNTANWRLFHIEFGCLRGLSVQWFRMIFSGTEGVDGWSLLNYDS